MITAGYQALATGLQTLIAKSAKLNASEIYTYEPNRPQGYPACTITLKQANNAFADTSRNQRSFIFNVRVYQEMLDVTGGEAEAESIIRSAADDIIGLIEQDTTQLSGVLSGKGYIKPITGDFKYLSSPDVKVRGLEFQVEFIVIE